MKYSNKNFQKNFNINNTTNIKIKKFFILKVKILNFFNKLLFKKKFKNNHDFT